jgi:diguanylate cyclase (GGDEF)-like protein/PAS domain S-box-containing protein/hemerythrin-like metal-binding protein
MPGSATVSARNAQNSIFRNMTYINKKKNDMFRIWGTFLKSGKRGFMKSRHLASLPKDDKLFFNVFQYAAIGMALVSLDGTWLMVNKALCSLVGYNEEDLLKLSFQDITHPEDLEEDLHYVQKVLSGDIHTYQMEKRYFHKDGRIIHILLSVSMVRDEKNTPLFFISQIQDITERKQLENELVRQANEDMLTGISNRRRFYDLAEREVFRGRRYNDPMVLLMLDIDHFKKINDTFGHATGDEALRRMAAVCRSELRAIDLFGRIGGEEFGVLLIRTDAITGRQVAERLRQAVEQCILTTDTSVVKFTVSIGGVAFSGNDLSLDQRLKQADDALYKAKSKGRNRTELVDNLKPPAGEAGARQSSFVRLEWHADFNSGNPQIDDQHRNLFNRSNRLLEVMITRQEGKIEPCFKELISDVSAHFTTEEEILEQAGYPYTKEHREIHRKLEDDLLEMANQSKKGLVKTADVFHFLAFEVINRHLLEEDCKFFSLFLNQEA